MNYVNYHSHTQMSNVMTPDSTISNKDRALRTLELGQKVLTSVEHGWCGRFIETVELSKEHGLKPLIGAETYFVKDRLEKDNTNAHLIVLAKNESGRKALNKILSEANETGFYYKPRIDKELVLSLPANDVWITTACVGGIWQYDEDYENLVAMFQEHFKRNFFLEVQYHQATSQSIVNHKAIALSNRYDIRIIAGMDSHMITTEQATERDNYLLSRGISYPSEENWMLDFPSYDEAVERFIAQNDLNKYQIEEALNNTNIFEDVEEYDSPIFDNETIKLPTLFPNKNQEEKNQILTKLVMRKWEEEKNNVISAEIPHYEEEIKRELDIVFETHMADYFLLDYEIIKKGKENNGSITMTGRGSAPSFYLSKLLGFTTIDRISASVKLFPERFISTERLLESKSLPDIDFNLGTPEVFADAQTEVMGDGHAYQMIAFNTVQVLGAWKMYARASDVDFDTANLVSDQIQKYLNDLKYADDNEKDSLDILEYINEKYLDMYQESQKYIGLVNTLTPHPCAYLIFSDGDIREEFGLIKIKTGDVEHICVCCDGLFAENYKMLKNDLLKVSVVDLIYKTYERIGRKPHSLPELIKLCEDDDKVWDIYKNGHTIGINQVEQTASKGRAIKYAPRNISELSAFVAAIRPGFQSNYKQFEAREPFSYGIPSLDNLIQTKEFPQSYLLYQENAMQVLAYAGIPISQTYDILKNIAKKRAEKVFKYKKQFISGMKKRIVEIEKRSGDEAQKIADMTWQIIEDSSRYSFNSSHAYSMAGDSLYGAYLKAHYPLEFYETILRLLEEDGNKDRLTRARIEAEEGFGISFPSFRFGQDNRTIVANKEANEIVSSIKTIKGFGSSMGDDLYEISQKFSNGDFIDLLIYSEEMNMLSSKWDGLIRINYFEEFGNNRKLLKIYEEFRNGKNKFSRSLQPATKNKRISKLKRMFKELPNERLSFMEQIEAENEVLGYMQSTYPVSKKYIYVTDLNTKYSPRIQAYCLNNGKQESLKIRKAIYEAKPFLNGSIIKCKSFEKKPSVSFVNGEFVKSDTEFTWWISEYDIVNVNEFTKTLDKK